MIGKISKGATFSGCINYVLGKEDAELLASDGVMTENRSTIIDCFQAQRMMKPNIRQPVGHISLSYAPEDASRLTDELMVKYAMEYMEKMGIKDTQYIIARHSDQKHPHIHLVYNRVDNNGQTISDKNDRYRNTQVCKELKDKYSLYFGKDKDRVRIHRLKGKDKTKYEIYHAVKAASAKATDWKRFSDLLAKQGIQTILKYKGKSDTLQGISFTKDGITFKASEVDRNFSFAKLDKQFEQNGCIQQAENKQSSSVYQEQTHSFAEEAVEGITQGLGGLFTLSSNPVEDNPYNPNLRKKKKESDFNH